MKSEFEDVASVIDSIGRPVDIFGHSFGGSVVLGASLIARNLRKIILYEPSPGVMATSHETFSRLEALLERGEREELVILVMREVIGMSPEMLQRFQASPQWANRVAIAHTIVRELRGEDGWAFDPKQFQRLSNPALLLLGSESPDWAKSGTKRVKMALLDSRVHILEGQRHIATVAAPELVAKEVIRFCAR
jgi:pimeloyl-ACP methyl ester carboxylesterase